MKLLVITSLLLVSLLASTHGDKCSCTKPDKGETTHEGGNELVTFIEREPYKTVSGVVHDQNGEPLEGVLVEVFDGPEWILENRSSSPMKQNRIAVCKTTEDGKFCFNHIPSGEYELVGSKDAGWNPSHVYIKVRPDDPKARTGIELDMQIGQ